MKELSYHAEIFLWLISAPKDTIKTLSRDVWMFLTKFDTPYYTGLLYKIDKALSLADVKLNWSAILNKYNVG